METMGISSDERGTRMIDILQELTEDQIQEMDYDTLCLVESIILNEATMSSLVGWFIKQTGGGMEGNIDPGRFFGGEDVLQDDKTPFPSGKARVNSFLTKLQDLYKAKETDAHIVRTGRGTYSFEGLSSQQKDILSYITKRDPEVWAKILGENPEASTTEIAGEESKKIGYEPSKRAEGPVRLTRPSRK